MDVVPNCTSTFCTLATFLFFFYTFPTKQDVTLTLLWIILHLLYSLHYEIIHMHSSLIFASMKRALWGGKHLFCYANNNHGKVLKGEKKYISQCTATKYPFAPAETLRLRLSAEGITSPDASHLLKCPLGPPKKTTLYLCTEQMLFHSMSGFFKGTACST